MTSELKLPDTGMGITEATIVKWCKREGDPVEVDELVAEIETAKATVDVVSPFRGVVEKLLMPEGTTAEVDAVIALIRVDA